MGGTHRKVSNRALIIDEATSLELFCPDLANWPHTWRYEESDEPIGHDLVEHLKPFLLELLRQPLSDNSAS
jgi:hypothetical protein